MIIMCRFFLTFTDNPDCASNVGLPAFTERFAIVFNAQGICLF
jgi:hypothetical protein